MKRQITAIALAAAALVSSGAMAVPIITNATPIPDSLVLLNFGGSGLDWVYAGPVGPGDFGPGQIENASYRAAEGWRAATAPEWAGRPDWDDFIVPGNPCGIGGPGFQNNTACYRFTSQYWSTFTHVDAGDFASGFVTDGVNNACPGCVYETIYVRDSRNAVPVPGTLALAGLSLIAVGALRRKA